MMNTDTLYSLTLLLGILGYLLIVGKYIALHRRLHGSAWLLAAIMLWPLGQLDEWLKYAGVLSQVVWVSSLFDFVPVAIATCLYKATKAMVTRNGATRPVLVWLPVLCIAMAQIAVILSPLALRLSWLAEAPTGFPMTHWPVYLVALLTGFGVLLFSIMSTELLQNYHRYLPEQVVDTAIYRIRWLTGANATVVGLSFVAILLVTAATFGFFAVPFWLSAFHVGVNLVMLFMLGLMVADRQTSPSPLDHDRLQSNKGDISMLRAIATQAEQVVIDQKAYKTVGLRIEDFARMVGDTDPTTLALALHLQSQMNFRAFIYQYRLDYAKNVLMRTDTKIATVAKRLGLNSEKFLSDVLVKHLQKH